MERFLCILRIIICYLLTILSVFVNFKPSMGQQVPGTPVTYSVSLDFPIRGYVPYRAAYFESTISIAPINSILDHSINSKPDGTPSYYTNDNGVIQTYTGEKGERQYCTPSELAGVCSGTESPSYPNKDHQAFEINGSYIGRPSGYVFLQYEGHAGYDYNLTGQIIAPADGLLVIPRADPINGNLGTVSPWCGFHTFYIDHGNGYTTWYLHADHLNSLLGGPEPYDYCAQAIPEDIKLGRVTRGQYIADVGGWGRGQPSTFGLHLHFEFRKNGIPIDPYGWRTDEVDPVQQWETSINLWNHPSFKADPSVRWHPDGTLIRAKSEADVFLIDNERKKKISSQDIFNSYGFLWQKVIEVQEEELACYEEEQNNPLDISPKLVRQIGEDNVYLIFDNEFKKAITDPEVFEGLFGKDNWTMIEEISEDEMNSYQEHPSSPELFSPFPDGTLIKAYGVDTVYVISNGKKMAIASSFVFNSLGYNWDEVVRVPVSVLDNIPQIPAIIDENQILRCGYAGFNRADLNHDGFVNAIDFSILLHYWGSTSKPVADINQNGYVNAQDLSIMMSNWYNPLPVISTTNYPLTSLMETSQSRTIGLTSQIQNQTTLSLSPSTGSYLIGESFNIDIIMNTGGQNVVVAAAYVKYDSTKFRVNSVDTTSSVFTMEPEKIINTTIGIAGITRGVITPGINTANGKIATVNLTALSPINPKTDNLTIVFTPGSTVGSAICRDDGLGKNTLDKVSNARLVVSENISLQSPLDGSIFNSCSLADSLQPKFSWTNPGTFKIFAIIFSVSPTDFGTPIVREVINFSRSSWIPALSIWKKIMKTSYNNGNIRYIYWKIIGMQSGRISIESEIRKFRIGECQPLVINSPLDNAVIINPPTFNFDSKCNTDFKIEFSPISGFGNFRRIITFIFSVKHFNSETTINWTLTQPQWSAVKRLVGDGPGYFRIKARDRINRETISEVRSFTT